MDLFSYHRVALRGFHSLTHLRQLRGQPRTATLRPLRRTQHPIHRQVVVDHTPRVSTHTIQSRRQMVITNTNGFHPLPNNIHRLTNPQSTNHSFTRWAVKKLLRNIKRLGHRTSTLTRFTGRQERRHHIVERPLRRHINRGRVRQTTLTPNTSVRHIRLRQ